MDFDAKKAVDATVKWIRDWFDANGPGCNAIIGISGGKDSSIMAGMLVEALGKERVIGVLMPNGEQSDIDMAKLLVDHLGIEHYIINIKSAYDGIIGEIEKNLCEVSRDTEINLPPRLRMSTLYAIGQSRNGRVANTCNLSEDWVGYSTRYGDSVGDFSALSCFTTAEIRAMGRVIGLPKVLIEKVPSDGLSGLSDEDKLGFTYEVLDRYIRTGEIDDPETKEKIDHLHRKNLFKLRYMDSFKYDGVGVKAEW
ncbi:MAG: NAD(+) synthase [Mogibacterium sp.]|nr:NAD(+) synthase [Mogibacterium sp.]